jgi:PAS domain S-box-containing protein
MHRALFTKALATDGLDVAATPAGGGVVFLDARQMLDEFMDGATPNPERFRRAASAAIEQARGHRADATVHAFGEMVDLLWGDGNRDGAIKVEQLWNSLALEYRFSLLCAYRMKNFSSAADAVRFAQVCAEHSQVRPTERFVVKDEPGRLMEIALLEQRARSLEAEIRERALLADRLRDTVATLEQREHDLRDVLENAVEGIHLVGPDGVIQWANAAELALLGYQAHEYIGRPITDFHADPDVIADLLGRLGRGETVNNYAARLRHKDGSIRHVLVNSNVRWEGDTFRNTRCFTRDVTEVARANMEREHAFERERLARAQAEVANQEAQRARMVAEQANRAKSDFLAVMSHELRTPLNAIGGYAELMELGIQGPVTPQQRDSLERIQRSQRMLLGLVNQVLSYARIETGNARFELVDVALDETLRSVEALVAPQIRARGLRYVYYGCDPEVHVRADTEKLQQVLVNLLTNALKFTDVGGEIRLDVICDDAFARVNVTDTGIGIPADKLEIIFDAFTQVDPNYTRTRDGVGLGLAIGRDFARGMNGDLTASSAVGAGSCFTLSLPRA